MHSSTYIFTCKSGNITSYPHDYSYEIFKYAMDKAYSSVQIVLVRKDNLLHYCYVRKIREKQFFGICFKTDHIYNSVSDLFRAFDRVYADMVDTGILLQMDSEGSVIIRTNQFAKESVEINEKSEHFINSLALSAQTTQPLPPADFSKSINECIELSIEKNKDQEIIDAIKKYCKVYIVKTQAEIARLTSVTSIIKRKNDEIKELQKNVTQRDDTISALKKQKNKFKWVIILLSIIFISFIVFSIVMQSKNDTIYDLKEENAKLGKHVSFLQKDSVCLSDNLRKTTTQLADEQKRVRFLRKDSISKSRRIDSCQTVIYSLKNEISSAVENERKKYEKVINDYNNNIKDLVRNPLIIYDIEIANSYKNGTIETDYGQTIYSTRTMYLKPKIKYIGFTSGNKTLRLKLYNPNGTISQGTYNNKPSPSDCTYADDFNISIGKNECPLVGWGNEQKGHWKKGKYKIEIWHSNICLYSKQFTIY